jgi:hypothetical protein
MLVYLLFGLKVKNIDCAFKISKRDVIENIKLQSSGAFINPEFLIHTHKKRLQDKKGYKEKNLNEIF